jgi:hypothetical protein
MAGLPDAVTQHKNLAGQSLRKEDDAQSLAILLVASAAQTMKEVESNV